MNNLLSSLIPLRPIDLLTTSSPVHNILTEGSIPFAKVIKYSLSLRFPLAKLIANRRAPIAKKIYEELGGSSPILKLTMKQATALEFKLNRDDNLSNYRCFIVMRCWHPRAESVVKEMAKMGIALTGESEKTGRRARGCPRARGPPAAAHARRAARAVRTRWPG